MMILDLLLVSIIGLSVWHTIMGKLLALSFIVLRIFTTFSLQDKRKSNWLPIALNSLWMLLFFVNDNHILNIFIINPALQLVKVLLAFIGCTGLGTIDEIAELNAETPQTAVLTMLTYSVSIFYYLWILLYPIVVYFKQWKRKEFTDTKILNGSVVLVIGYIVFAFITSAIVSLNRGYLMIGQYNAWMFIMAGLPLTMYLKEKKHLSGRCKMYLVMLAIFYCAYIIGKEMTYSLSMVGIVMLPALFYYVICKAKGVQLKYKDWSILLIGSIAFLIAQDGCNWVRILFLSISAVAYGYEAFSLSKKGISKKFALMVFLTTGVVLPSMALGYNQYSVLNARKLYKYNNYLYAHNGVLVIYNPTTKKYGLRDRYGEIIPCLFDWLTSMDNYNKPFVKVRKGKHWGVFDIEKNKLIIEPVYTKIEKFSKNSYRLTDEDGCNRYLQIKPYYYSGYEDEELWQIIDNPNEYLIREEVEAVNMILQEGNIENKPHLSHIYNYIVSTFFAAEEQYDCSEIYWNWAQKCTNMIETVALDNNIFIADTARVSEQAIERVNKMLSINSEGNLSETTCYSFVKGVAQLYLAIDNNQQIAKIDTLLWKKGFKEEYELWMDFYWSSYKLYADVILKDESYSDLRADLNSTLENNAEWRLKMQKECIDLFNDKKTIKFSGKEATDEELKKFIRKMDDNGDEPCLADTLRISMLQWLHHRDNMLKDLDPKYRESYKNQTKRIRHDLSYFLKNWSDDFELHKKNCAIRAQIAEDESDKILLNN